MFNRPQGAPSVQALRYIVARPARVAQRMPGHSIAFGLFLIAHRCRRRDGRAPLQAPLRRCCRKRKGQRLWLPAIAMAWSAVVLALATSLAVLPLAVAATAESQCHRFGPRVDCGACATCCHVDLQQNRPAGAPLGAAPPPRPPLAGTLLAIDMRHGLRGSSQLAA